MNIDIKNIISKIPVQKLLIAALVIVCILSVRQCRIHREDALDTNTKLQMYKNQSSQYADKINKYGEVVSTQNAMIVERDSKLQKELLVHSELTKLKIKKKKKK